MLKLLNAGFGSPIGQADLALIRGLGFDGVRQDIRTMDNAGAVVAELAGLDAVLVLDPAVWDRALEIAFLCDQHTVRAWLEVGNELDNVMRSVEYAVQFERVRNATRGYPCITAGVRNTSPTCLAWAAHVATLTNFDYLGVHPYRSGSPGTVEQRGSEMAQLTRYRWACTEVGWTDARTSKWPCRRPLSEGQVADFLRREIAINEALGSPLCVTYQLNDGPGKDPRDHMGIRRLDGTLKPSAYVCIP